MDKVRANREQHSEGGGREMHRWTGQTLKYKRHLNITYMHDFLWLSASLQRVVALFKTVWCATLSGQQRNWVQSLNTLNLLFICLLLQLQTTEKICVLVSWWIKPQLTVASKSQPEHPRARRKITSDSLAKDDDGRMKTRQNGELKGGESRRLDSAGSGPA